MMRNTIIAVVLTWAASANAQMLADGSYQMTGNAAIDVGLTVVNALNKEIAVKHDFQKFYVNSGRLDQALEKRLDELGEAKKRIFEERQKHLNATDELRKAAKSTDDPKKAAALEEKAAALKVATAEIDKAAKALDEGTKLGEQMRRTIGQMRGKDEKQALADWNGGLRKQLETLQGKMRGRLETYAKSLTNAGKEIQKGSDTTTKPELVGAFTAEVTALSGAKNTELWVNGQKLKVGDKVGVGKDNKLELRAVIVSPRREQARKFQQELAQGKTSTREVVVSAADEYTLAYSLGPKKSDWKVAKETYEWRAPATRTGANLLVTRRASGAIAKQDVLDITFPAGTASETIRGYVYGVIEWKNGPTQEDASEGLTWEIKIYPTR